MLNKIQNILDNLYVLNTHMTKIEFTSYNCIFVYNCFVIIQ